MSTKMQTKVQASPAQNFTPVRTGILQRKCALCNTPGLVEDSKREKEKLTLQRSSADQAGTTTVPPIVHGALRSSGQPLDTKTRALMEPRFGHDFSKVRVHTDAQAAESARAVNALAYTVGTDIVFDTGRYVPETESGSHLLAHELVHVVQQGGATSMESNTEDGSDVTLEEDVNKTAAGATVTQQGSIIKEGATDRLQNTLLHLRSGLRLQRFMSCDSEGCPLAAAVQNGPGHATIDNPHQAGMSIDVNFISDTGGAVTRGYIKEEVNVDPRGSDGSFVNHPPEVGTDVYFQDVNRVPPDIHAWTKTSIIQHADNYGAGRFTLLQLDIYKETPTSDPVLIPWSGYVIIHDITTGPGRRIDFHIQKRAASVTVNSYTASAGRNAHSDLNPTYYSQVTVRGEGTEELRPTGPTSRLFGYGQRAAASESHAPFIAHRGIPDAGVIEEETPDAGVPGGVEATDPEAPLPQQLQTGSFSHTAAAAYARRWALGTNPGFPRFAGNDCTNFVSQAMLEGGWTMIGGSVLDRTRDNVWWYGRSRFARASHTWAGAQKFANFCRVSGRATRVSDPMQLNPGDVLQLEHGGHISHSMVVTGKTDTDLLLSYHTTDRLDEPLSNIRASSPMVVFVPWRIS